METGESNHVGKNGPVAWVARVMATTDSTCRVPRPRNTARRILIVSPSMFVRMALVRRLSDVVSFNVFLVLAEDLDHAPVETYDLMVVGPYLSSRERERVLLFHAGRAGGALIELADSEAVSVPNESVRVERAGHGRLETLTRAVCAALSTPSDNLPHGGTNA